MSIAVMGAGAFGTALAIAISQGDQDVTLWGRDADAMKEAVKSRTVPRLRATRIPDHITITADLPEAEITLLAVPAQTVGTLLQAYPKLGHSVLVSCSKGIDLTTMKGPTALIAHHFPNATAAVLTGPSFAADIARGLPTALTLACADETAATDLQQQLSTLNFRLYSTTDTVGAEMGGALKNVIAVACGAAMGLGLGDSTRAALMTRGFAEMTRFAVDFGARPETLVGLSGLGDLALTCGSEQSRNFRFGKALGEGQSFDEATTVEGVKTAQAVAQLASTRGIDMPICSVVADMVEGRLTAKAALHTLLSRPLKQE